MKRAVLRVFLFLLVVGSLAVLYGWYSLVPPRGPEPVASTFTLDNVTLITPGKERLADQAIGVADGLIRDRGPKGSVTTGKVISDFEDAFVLPGLMDLHTHLPSDTPLSLTRLAGLLYLVHGVTTIRESGDLVGTSVRAARRIFNEEGRAGPRLFSAGWFVSGGEPRWANTIVVDSKDAVRAAVARIRAEGHHSVKSYENLSVKLIREVESAAHEMGLKVIGHVPTSLAYEEARIEDTLHFLGVPLPRNVRRDHIYNRIADWAEVDASRINTVVQATLDHDIANTPTLVMSWSLLRYRDYEAAIAAHHVRLLPRMFRDVVWHPGEGLALWRNLTPAQLEHLQMANAKKLTLLRALYEAGADLRIGTDTLQPFVVPGHSVHEEMKIFAEAGIPAEAIWEMATWRAGQALGNDNLGTLDIGAPADMLVFAEDPTKDLAALDSLVAVISQGRLYKREDLDAAIAAWQRHSEGWVFDTLSVAATRRILAEAVKRGN